MRIIKTNVSNLEEDKKALYKLTKAPSEKMQSVPSDRVLPVDAYVVYTETKTAADGSEKETEVLALISGGQKFATISPSFIREFKDIAELMDGDGFGILVKQAVSKAGRTFISCELDC